MDAPSSGGGAGYGEKHLLQLMAIRLLQAPTEVVVTGLVPAGERRTFRFAVEERDEPAIRLLWASRRVRHRLQVQDRAGALALTRHHNLVCEGVAFVGRW